MKKYHCIIETTEAYKYECLLDSKYALEDATKQVSDAKPDTMVMFGTDFSIRAGAVSAAYITGEQEVE